MTTESTHNASSMGRRERKKQATRTSILRAALDLFIIQGYSGTTVAQIAERADVSESTFFNHFGTKEELILERIDGKAEALVTLLDERETATTVDVLRDYLGGLADKLEWLADFRRMLHGAIRVEPELLELMIGRWSQTARPALRDSFARDLGDSPDAFRTEIITAIAVGLSNHVAYVMYADEIDDARIVAFVQTTLETLTKSYNELRETPL
jgi:AcrR family transcriptional regulator